MARFVKMTWARWRSTSASARNTYLDSLEVLNTARVRGGKGINETAADVGGVTGRRALVYISPATTKDTFGKIVPKPADRLMRPMEILDDSGNRVLRPVYGSRSASDIGRHEAALSRFVETGDVSLLEPFRGMRRGGVELASDPSVIERVAREGDLEDLEPYPRTAR
jgi:hypothetical protein